MIIDTYSKIIYFYFSCFSIFKMLFVTRKYHKSFYFNSNVIIIFTREIVIALFGVNFNLDIL